MTLRYSELPEACRCSECGYTIENPDTHCPELGACPVCGAPRLWRVKSNPGVVGDNPGIAVPSYLPKAAPVGAKIQAGAYTDIVSISAPSEAEGGETVNIDVAVKNTWTGSFYVTITGQYNGVSISPSIDYLIIDPGQTLHFYFAFTMPNHDIRVDFWSWYWADSEWYEDDHDYVSISLATLASEFRNITIYSVEPAQAEIGDVVRITARIEHRGAEATEDLYAAIGNQNSWFDEILHNQKGWVFPESSSWVAYLPYVDITITSAISDGVYDVYAKLKGLISPTEYNCLTIQVLPEPSFRGFEITQYVGR